jgi:hypothetical protein
MKFTCLFLIASGATLGGCGGGSPQPAQSRFIHNPPIERLNAQQLRSLSMECEKYAPSKVARGPYDAAYCEYAIAAWADAPLQLIPAPITPSQTDPSKITPGAAN